MSGKITLVIPLNSNACSPMVETIEFVALDGIIISLSEQLPIDETFPLVMMSPFEMFSCSILNDVPQLYYQHISGSYDTASAFGLKIAAEIIKKQEIPDVVQYNKISVATIQSILVINQSLGTDFSLTLLTSC